MKPFREAPKDVVQEIIEWLKISSNNTINQAGIGSLVDCNSAIGKSGLLIADEIERRWGWRTKT